MDYLIKTGEWQKLQQLRQHGDTIDALFPKFSLILIFWQLLGNKYNVNISYCGSKISHVQGEVMGFFKDESVRIRSAYFLKFTLL